MLWYSARCGPYRATTVLRFPESLCREWSRESKSPFEAGESLAEDQPCFDSVEATCCRPCRNQWNHSISGSRGPKDWCRKAQFRPLLPAEPLVLSHSTHQICRTIRGSLRESSPRTEIYVKKNQCGRLSVFPAHISVFSALVTFST